MMLTNADLVHVTQWQSVEILSEVFHVPVLPDTQVSSVVIVK